MVASAENLKFDVGEEAPRDVVEALVASRLGRTPIEEEEKKKPSGTDDDPDDDPDDDDDDEADPGREPPPAADPRTRLELRGRFEGAHVLVGLDRTPLQRGGTRPFTEVVLEEDLGATIELRGAHGLHLTSDAPMAFRSESLADLVLVGAPNAVVREIRDLLDARFAALFAAGAEVITLEIGPYAERAGTKKRGVRLVCRGWPLDEASLDHLLQTVLVIRTNITAQGSKLARHPEVISHERALAFGSPTAAGVRRTKLVALVGIAFFVAAILLAVLVLLTRG